MAGKSKYDRAAPRILAAIVAGATVAKACELANIGQETYYGWQRNKPEFSEAITRARERFVREVDSDLAAQFTARLLDLTLNGHTVTKTTRRLVRADDGEMITVSEEVETLHYSAPPRWVADKLMPDSLAEQALGAVQATQVNVNVGAGGR